MNKKQTLLAAVVQLRSTPDVERNLERLQVLTKRAAERGADLVAWPECAVFLGPDNGRFEAASAHGDLFQQVFQAAAVENEIHLLIGSYPELSSTPDKTYNTSLLLGPTGDLLAKYRKIHLFDVDTPAGESLRESDHVLGADEVVTGAIETRSGERVRVGLSICYDLRFPELYRRLTAEGAEILTIPAAFTAETGKDHWRVLLQARAIENLCFVIAPNQWGVHFGQRRSHGRSAIIDPWGIELAVCADGEGVAAAEIDLASLRERRRSFPCLEHRRLMP